MPNFNEHSKKQEIKLNEKLIRDCNSTSHYEAGENIAAEAERVFMNQKECIEGIEDLIQDRESFIGNEEEYTIFHKDIEVLKEAIRRIKYEGKLRSRIERLELRIRRLKVSTVALASATTLVCISNIITVARVNLIIESIGKITEISQVTTSILEHLVNK